MKPIPTANAMKPAPGKGVSSFPTPVIKDTVIVEVVNAWSGSYTPLEYGTKWDDVPHASVQGSFPDHKLVSQSPNSEDGQWVKRIWANDRVDQDTYNYAIKYSGGSDAHPIYIRTYVELRETYAPVPDLSPDPLFPGAFLVEEEVQRQEDELDSRYVKVIRTYETLPGPSITSQRYTERGDIETVSSQQVFPSTSPDPDGLFVTQSQVIKEDVSKGTKIKATVPSYTQLLVKEKKGGLLGETVTTDDIVDPSTNPDALSQSIVSSTIQQTSATKAVKRTTTASGPTQLSATSLVDSPVGQVPATVQQSIVAPDQIPEGGRFVLQDQISPIDVAKSQRERVTVPSYPQLTTYDLDPNINTVIITERTVVNHNAPYAAKPLMLELNDRPLDQWKTLRITTRLANVPITYVEYKTEQFTFPALLARITTKNLDVGFGNVTTSLDTSEFREGINKFVSITPVLRPAISLPTRIKITTEFFYGPTPPQAWINTETYQISTQNVSYSGSLFSFNFGDVITNQISVPESGPIVANDFDPKYGGVNKLSEQITFPASIPNYTQYMAKVNSSDPEIIIASQIIREKTNLWSRRVSSVRLV